MFKRVDSAEWHTDDLHTLWQQTPSKQSSPAPVSLHAFLDYCRVLQEIREQFERDDATNPYDKIVFFLRGGYFAYAYLNQVTSLFPRAAIFGGLSHGRSPEENVAGYIKKLKSEAQASGCSSTRLLIIDEVKSGSGMNRALRVIRDALNSESSGNTVDCDLTFYALRPGSQDDMMQTLRSAEERWAGKHAVGNSTFTITIRHFAGALLGYDNATMCGIHKVTVGSNPVENYEMVKLSRGTIEFVCDTSQEVVSFAVLIESCLVEFLSACALALTNQQGWMFAVNLQNAISTTGCDTCKGGLLTVLANGRDAPL